MVVDGAHVLLEKVRHLLLGQPDGFVLKPDFDAGPAVLRLVKNQFRVFWGLLCHGLLRLVGLLFGWS